MRNKLILTPAQKARKVENQIQYRKDKPDSMRRKTPLTPEQKAHKAEYAKKWRAANPDKTREHSKRTRLKNIAKYPSRQKAWAEKNKEHVQAKGRAYYLEKVDHIRNIQLQRQFGITLAVYNLMLQEQNYGCAICGAPNAGPKTFSVDHDHTTGKVRGLLCRGCNVGIGNLKDDPALLEKAIEYINFHRFPVAQRFKIEL